MEYDLKRILELINAEKWNWAKTYVNIPHEYIVRGKCKMSDAEFLYIVHAQRDIGKKEVWGKYNFPYLYVDGYKYWTMGDTFENTIILNRQKVFSEFDLLDISESYYTINEAKQIYSYISRTFKDKVIFETGFGFGTFVKDSGIKPSNYYGVEPSKKAIDFFRTKNPGFYRRVSNKSFEESVDEEKAKHFRIADNKVAEKSEYDEEKLYNEIRNLEIPEEMQAFFFEDINHLLNFQFNATDINDQYLQDDEDEEYLYEQSDESSEEGGIAVSKDEDDTEDYSEDDYSEDDDKVSSENLHDEIYKVKVINGVRSMKVICPYCGNLETIKLD